MQGHAASFIDPAELSKTADLNLLARMAVLGFKTGLHRSVHTGSSAEFAQYRPYTQGDDLKFIDWRLYGRTDRLHVKEFQDETNLRCTVLLDCSASMDYGSGKITKFRYAQMLAACLVLMLAEQHDAVGFISYDKDLGVQIGPRAHSNHARIILSQMDKLRATGATDTAGALSHLGNVLPPRGMVILVSDLLHPLDEVLKHLRSLRARRHDVVVFQICDPAERTFPFERGVTLLDVEDGREQFAIPDEIRAEYLASRAAHFALIRSECLASEIDIEEFSTDQPLDYALHHYVNRRNHALVTSSRRGSGGRGGG